MAKTTTRKPLTEKEKAARAKAQAEKFQELATKRVSRALKAISLVGNLSGSGYQSTTEQVEKIRTALETAVERTMSRFEKTKSAESEFSL